MEDTATMLKTDKKLIEAKIDAAINGGIKQILSKLDIYECVSTSSYCFVSADDFILSDNLSKSLNDFVKFWNSLALDTYLPKQHGTRLRCHGQFRYCPENSSIKAMPHSAYIQSKENNSLVGGIYRTFAPLQQDVYSNEFFLEFLKFNIRALRLKSDKCWNINAHFVRIPCTTISAGVPCPEGVHRDGFSFVSIHLMNRMNISDAVTTIYDKNSQEIFSLVLNDTMDSIYAADNEVLHYTAPFFCDNAKDGYRDTLLLSYEPEK